MSVATRGVKSETSASVLASTAHFKLSRRLFRLTKFASNRLASVDEESVFCVALRVETGDHNSRNSWYGLSCPAVRGI